MTKVQWKVNESRKYRSTTLEELMNSWDPNEELKFCKVMIKRKDVVEFILYNSENYTKKSIQYASCVILDRFQILITTRILSSPSLKSEFDRKIKKISRSKVNIKHWYDHDTVKKELETIEELLSNIESYEVMDILVG